jgi:hypothetical protein
VQPREAIVRCERERANERASALSGREQQTLRRRQMHDPMLLFNILIFTSTDGRAGIFDQVKIHENGT